MKNINNRITEYPIEDIFLKRYSPRAMSGEKISEEEALFLQEKQSEQETNSCPKKNLNDLLTRD